MPKRTHNLPKSITIHRDKLVVKIYAKKTKKLYFIGQFDTLEEAIKNRDEWIVKNYNLVEGYLPRGITKSKSEKRYVAQLSFRNKESDIGTYRKHLGSFDTLQEAVDYRKNFILGLL